jgi:DNA-binding transcriptional MocR family regulator
MFSARTGWTRAPNRLSAVVAARRRSGAPAPRPHGDEPDAAGLRAPADVLAALADPAALAYEPEPLGARPRARPSPPTAAAGTDVDPDRLLLTASTSEAYAFAFKLLCDPGDTILVPRPSYPLFEYLAGLESVHVGPTPCATTGPGTSTWRISPARSRRARARSSP